MKWMFVVHHARKPSYELLSWHVHRPHQGLVMPDRWGRRRRVSAIFIRVPLLHYLLAPTAPEVTAATSLAIQQWVNGSTP